MENAAQFAAAGYGRTISNYRLQNADRHERDQFSLGRSGIKTTYASRPFMKWPGQQDDPSRWHDSVARRVILRMSGSMQGTVSAENEMNRLLIGAVSAMIITGLATLAKAEDSSDAIAAGRQLALQVCSVCHVVAPNQEFAPRLDQSTPSFEDIANRPGMSAEFLHKFITTTHWDEKTIPMTMPNPMLGDDQITQVSSYILSLRKHP